LRRKQDIDILTGKEEADALEMLDVVPVPRNWLEKVWFWVA
jgi:amino acid transporter